MILKRISAFFATLAATLCVYAQPENYDSVHPFVHDPVVAECDGNWYMFTTGYCIDILKSPDFLNWSYEGHAFSKAPAWAVKSVPGYNGHTWAPDICFHDGLYYLYYSCSSFGKNTSAIGVATNRTLDPESRRYKWKDHGCVVSSVAGRDLWNAIDPNLFIDDDGTPWLSFGSFWGGIKLVRLDNSLLKVAEPQEWYPVCRRPEGTAEDTSRTDTKITADPRGADYDPGNGAVEAPFIVKRNGLYYLFVSYDLCCRGALSTYKVVVGRADKVTGPYYDATGLPMMQGGGTTVVSGNDRFPGVGHCAVVRRDNADYLVFHAYDKEHDYTSVLLTRKIEWDSEGWPEVTL